MDQLLNNQSEDTGILPEDAMNSLLAHSCPLNVLEDGWHLFQFELCDFTFNIEAKCTHIDINREKYYYEIRKLEIK